MKCLNLMPEHLKKLDIPLLNERENVSNVPLTPASKQEYIYILSPNETVCAFSATRDGGYVWFRYDKELKSWVQTHLLLGENWMYEPIGVSS